DLVLHDFFDDRRGQDLVFPVQAQHTVAVGFMDELNAMTAKRGHPARFCKVLGATGSEAGFCKLGFELFSGWIKRLGKAIKIDVLKPHRELYLGVREGALCPVDPQNSSPISRNHNCKMGRGCLKSLIIKGRRGVAENLERLLALAS